MVFKIFKLQQWSQAGWGAGAGGSTKLYTHLRFVKNILDELQL